MSHEFLHRHERWESFSNLSGEHVIVDKDNWEEARREHQLIENVSKEDLELLDGIIFNNGWLEEYESAWKRVRLVLDKKVGTFGIGEIVRIKRGANLPKRYLGKKGRVVVKVSTPASVSGYSYYLAVNNRFSKLPVLDTDIEKL